MTAARHSTSAEVRAKLDHPVIDADGHHLELGPVFLDYLKDVGGQSLVDRYLGMGMATGDLWMRENSSRVVNAKAIWWAFPARNTLDRATALLPKLFYSRLDELGIDFAIVYPTVSRGLAGLEDPEMRAACCRAYNAYAADQYREFRDRLTPVALIPVSTPQEAVAAVEHAVRKQGFKAIMIAGGVSMPRRPVPGLKAERPEAAALATQLDFLALDSQYDYDPFWAKCVELKVPVTSHSAGMGWESRRSPANAVNNHIGHFAACGEAFCRAVFLGGVTRRFPTLNFAFLEGGVAWGCSLLTNLVFDWERRNPTYLSEELDPALIDRGQLLRLIEEYGDKRTVARLEDFRQIYARELPRPQDWDDFEACRIERTQDVLDLFVPRFYFGCEADDPTNVWAFNTRVNPLGARLRAVFGSDVGHYDVKDMSETLHEAHEMVDKGLITPADFRDFTFTNPATLYAGMNPGFFKGTRVEGAVAKLAIR